MVVVMGHGFLGFLVDRKVRPTRRQHLVMMPVVVGVRVMMMVMVMAPVVAVGFRGSQYDRLSVRLRQSIEEENRADDDYDGELDKLAQIFHCSSWAEMVYTVDFRYFGVETISSLRQLSSQIMRTSDRST